MSPSGRGNIHKITEVQTSNRINEEINPNCRLCGNENETIQHIVSFPNLTTSIYLPLRHNKVTNVIYQNIVPGEEK